MRDNDDNDNVDDSEMHTLFLLEMHKRIVRVFANAYVWYRWKISMDT